MQESAGGRRKALAVSAAPTSPLRRPLPGAAALPAAVLRTARRVPIRVRIGLLLAVLGLAGLYLWLRDSPLVGVRHVTVVGLHGPQAAAVRSALTGTALDQTTLDLDAAALRRSVSAYPLVRSVELHPHFPHGLTIVVESERPVAWLAAGGRRVAVNATGKLLRGAFAGLSLPTVPVSLEPVGGHVSDPRILRTLDALAEAPPGLAARVRRLRLVPGTGLVATLRRGPELRLGNPSRLAAKWLVAASVLADPSSRGARYIDLTVPGRPVAGGVGSGPGAATAPAPTPAPAAPTPATAAPYAATPSTTPPATAAPPSATPLAYP